MFMGLAKTSLNRAGFVCAIRDGAVVRAIPVSAE